MEIESTVYFSHGDAAVNDALRALFELVCCNAHRYVEDPKKREKAFAAAANKMKAGSGKLAEKLMRKKLMNVKEFEFGIESIGKAGNFTLLRCQHGSCGDQMVVEMIELIGKLAAEPEVRAFGSFDEDAPEFWLVLEDRNVQRRDVPSDEDWDNYEEERRETFEWWKEGLPKPLQKTIGKELGLTGGRRKAIPSPW